MGHSCLANAGLASFYDGRHVFYTGATGVLGMAFISRLVLDTQVSRIYALVRGGEIRFWQALDRHLPHELVNSLRLSKKLVILEGDITLPNYGLDVDAIETIRRTVSVIIHGASTLHLKHKLAYMATNIIQPSLAIARLALSCQNLARFVYISSAFANSFLRQSENGGVTGFDARIKEKIYPIFDDTAFETLDAQLAHLANVGNTPEFSAVRHPFAYSYAKHLTERLILREFELRDLADKLLIFRPSVIGPAESKPFPFYEVPGSCPGTMLTAAFVINPPRPMVFSSYLSDPTTATIDEIPVDIVVNSLIVHCAVGTSGCVHAVGGEAGRTRVQDAFELSVLLRRWWWGRPKLEWRCCDWKAPELCFVARLNVVLGCSFLFDQTKTQLVWETMSKADKQTWPLWINRSVKSKENAVGRKKAVKYLVGQAIVKRYGLPSWLSRLVCS